MHKNKRKRIMQELVDLQDELTLEEDSAIYIDDDIEDIYDLIEDHKKFMEEHPELVKYCYTSKQFINSMKSDDDFIYVYIGNKGLRYNVRRYLGRKRRKQ